jgi:hypothetical protein
MYCDQSQPNRSNLSLCVQVFVAFSLEIKVLSVSCVQLSDCDWTFVSFFCQLSSVFVAAGFLKDKLLLIQIQYLRYYLRSVEFWRAGCCQEAELHISAQILTHFNCKRKRQPNTTFKIKIGLQFGISVLDFPVAGRIVQTTKTRNNPLGNNTMQMISDFTGRIRCVCVHQQFSC